MWSNDKLASKVVELTTNEKLIKKDSEGKYVGKALTEVQKIIDYLNTANEKIARKIQPSKYEEIGLDENGNFYSAMTSKTFLEVNYIIEALDPESKEVAWEWLDSETIHCPGKGEGDSIYLNYQYLPDEIEVINGLVQDDYPFPRGMVPPELPAYFAAYEYLKTSDPTNADQWLVLWNVGFAELKANQGDKMTVTIVDKPIRNRMRGR